MVGGVVDGVDTDGVEAQLLELSDITLATFDVGNGILCVRSTAWLVVDAADVETFVACEEGCRSDEVSVKLDRSTKHLPMVLPMQTALRARLLPLPLTVTVGTLPELLPEALASILTGVATALATAAVAAVMATEPFIITYVMVVLRIVDEGRLGKDRAFGR